MDEDDDRYVQKDERCRRGLGESGKKRGNVLETIKREEQKAKRELQRAAETSKLVETLEADEDQGKKNKKKEINKESKEEKQKLYEKDMENCAKM